MSVNKQTNRNIRTQSYSTKMSKCRAQIHTRRCNDLDVMQPGLKSYLLKFQEFCELVDIAIV